MPFIRSLALAVATVTIALAFQPPTASPDKVVAWDRKLNKVITIEGTFAESPAGIVVSAGGKEKARISSADIIRVELGDMPGLSGDDRATLFSLENEKDSEKAARGYASLAKKGQGNERIRRTMEFRELMALARAADGKDESGFKATAPATADRLATFARANSKSWDVYPASRTAARLYAELGQHDKAGETLAALAAVPGLGTELKQETVLAEADARLRSGNPAAGRAIVAALLKDPEVPAAGSVRERLSLYSLWAQFPTPAPNAPGTPAPRPDDVAAKLQAAIDAAKSPHARAVGLNAKGELFLAFGLPRDAMWEFLNVEVVYHQDKDEVDKALSRLVEIFEALGEKDRADQYREKRRKLR
jgi:hypothetical protein